LEDLWADKTNDDTLPEPDVFEALKDYRWITEDERPIHYISEAMGKLAESGYIPPYGWEWGYWPKWLLDSTLTHYMSKIKLNEKRKIASLKKKSDKNYPEKIAGKDKPGLNMVSNKGNHLSAKESAQLQKDAASITEKLAKLQQTGKFKVKK
jgi:hypothetical protein